MSDFINRREIFKKYSYGLVNTEDIEELQNIFDYASGLIIKNSSLADSYETKITAKNSNVYIKACLNKDDYTDSQRETLKKMYKEENRYYKHLLENYNIDPFISRMADDYDILTSISKFNKNGSVTLERWQEELFLKCYKEALFYWNNVTRTKAFQNEEMYRSFTEIYLIFVTIQKYITERMKNQFDVDTFNKFQCKNYFISNGVDYFDDLPIFYQRRLIKLLNDLQLNKGDDYIFDYIKSVFATDNINIYKYILTKYQPTEEKPDGDLFFYKTPYEEELNTDLNERYTFESITENDPYWRASKNEILYQKFNILDTKYISVEYTVDLLKNSYAFSYFMYLLNDLKNSENEENQSSLLNYFDSTISSNEINLYTAVMALFSLFLTYTTNPEIDDFIEDSDIINVVQDSNGQPALLNIYGYKSYINEKDTIIIINMLKHTIEKRLEELKNINDTTKINWLNSLNEFLEEFNLKNFFYSENYSFEYIKTLYFNENNVYGKTDSSDKTLNAKYEFLELARFIKSTNIYNKDTNDNVNLFNLVATDQLEKALDYLLELIFSGYLNLEFISIHRNLKRILKKYLAYCIINGKIETNTSVDLNYYNDEIDLMYYFFVYNEVIFDEFLQYIESLYGSDLPLFDEFMQTRFNDEGPINFVKFIKNLYKVDPDVDFFVNDRLLRYRNFNTFLEVFTNFKKELYGNNSDVFEDYTTSTTLLKNVSKVNINNFMEILNKNEETRHELEYFITSCEDREIYKLLYELWYNKFKSTFFYPEYSDEIHFKDYVLHKDESLYSYITEFGTFENVNDLRKEIEERILNISTSIENYISSKENFIYNSTLNVLFSKIKDFVKLLIDVFKAYTLDTLYSGNVIEINDKMSNQIKIFDELDKDGITDLEFTTQPEYIDIQDSIYKDDNTLDVGYILPIQVLIKNNDEISSEEYKDRIDKYLKTIKCEIHIYEENDLPKYVTNDIEYDNVIKELYPPIKSFDKDAVVYDKYMGYTYYSFKDVIYPPLTGSTSLNKYMGDVYDEYKTYVENGRFNDEEILQLKELFILEIEQAKRFYIRDYKGYNFWISNRIPYNNKMMTARTLIPNKECLPDPINLPIGTTYIVSKYIIDNSKPETTDNVIENCIVINEEVNGTKCFVAKTNLNGYPSIIVYGNTYDTIPLNLGKRYYTFCFFDYGDLIDMYFNFYNGTLEDNPDLFNGPFLETTKTWEYEDEDGNIQTITHTMNSKDAKFIIHEFNTLINDTLNEFQNHGYDEGAGRVSLADIEEEIKMRNVVAIIRTDHDELWMYTGTDKSVNNGFEFLGAGYKENNIKVYYEPLRYYNWFGFDDQVIREERNEHKYPVTISLKEGEKLLPYPEIERIEKVFHRDYTPDFKTKAEINVSGSGIQGTHYTSTNLPWIGYFYNGNFYSYSLSKLYTSGYGTSNDVRDENFKFKVPDTINNNAYMLTITNSIYFPKTDTTIKIKLTDFSNESNFGYILVENKGITDYNNTSTAYYNDSNDSSRPLLNEFININKKLKANNSNLGFDEIDYNKGNSSLKNVSDLINSYSIRSGFGSVTPSEENDYITDSTNLIYDDSMNFNKFLNEDDNSPIYDYTYAKSIDGTEKIVDSGLFKGHLSNELLKTSMIILDENDNIIFDSSDEDVNVYNEEVIIEDKLEKNKTYRCILFVKFLNSSYNSGNFISNINTTKMENIIIPNDGIKKTITADKDGNSINIIDITFQTNSNKCNFELGVSGIFVFDTMIEYDFSERNNSEEKVLFYNPSQNRHYYQQGWDGLHDGCVVYYGDDSDVDILPFMYNTHTFDTSQNKKCRIMITHNDSNNMKTDADLYSFSIKDKWLANYGDNSETETLNFILQENIKSISTNYKLNDTKNYTFIINGKTCYDFNKDLWYEENNKYIFNYGENHMEVDKNNLFESENVLRWNPSINVKNISNKFVSDFLISSTIVNIYEQAFYKTNKKKVYFGPRLSNIFYRGFFSSNVEEIYFLNNSKIKCKNMPTDIYNPNINEGLLKIHSEAFQYTTNFKNTHFNLRFPKNLSYISAHSFEESGLNQIDFKNTDYLYNIEFLSFNKCKYLNRRYLTKNNKDYLLNGELVYEGDFDSGLFDFYGNIISSDYKFSSNMFIQLPYGQEKSIIRLNDGCFSNCPYIRFVDLGNTYLLGYQIFGDDVRLNYVLAPELIYLGNDFIQNAASNYKPYYTHSTTFCVIYNGIKYMCYNNYEKEVIIDGKSYYCKETTLQNETDKYYCIEDLFVDVSIADGIDEDGNGRICLRHYSTEEIYKEGDKTDSVEVNNGFRNHSTPVTASTNYSFTFNNCKSLLKVEVGERLISIAQDVFRNCGSYIKYNALQNKYYSSFPNEEGENEFKLINNVKTIKDAYPNTEFSVDNPTGLVITDYYNAEDMSNISGGYKINAYIDNENKQYYPVTELYYNGSLEKFEKVSKQVNWNSINLTLKHPDIDVCCDKAVESPEIPISYIPPLNEEDGKTIHNYFTINIEDNEIYFDSITDMNGNSPFDVYPLYDFEVDKPEDSDDLKILKANARYSLANKDEFLRIINEVDYNQPYSNEISLKDTDDYKLFEKRNYTYEEDLKNYFKDLNIIKVKDTKVNPEEINKIKVKIKSTMREFNGEQIPSRCFINNWAYFFLNFTTDKSTGYYTDPYYNYDSNQLLSLIKNSENNSNSVFKDYVEYSLGYHVQEEAYSYSFINKSGQKATFDNASQVLGAQKSDFYNDIAKPNTFLTPAVINNATAYQYTAISWTNLSYGLFGNDQPRGRLNALGERKIIFYNINTTKPLKDGEDINKYVINNCYIPLKALDDESNEYHQLFIDNIKNKIQHLTKYVRNDDFCKVPKNTINLKIRDESITNNIIYNKFTFIYKIYGVIKDSSNSIVGYVINGWIDSDDKYASKNRACDKVYVFSEDFYNTHEDYTNEEINVGNNKTLLFSDIYEDLNRCTSINGDIVKIAYPGGIYTIDLSGAGNSFDTGLFLYT